MLTPRGKTSTHEQQEVCLLPSIGLYWGPACAIIVAINRLVAVCTPDVIPNSWWQSTDSTGGFQP